MFSVTLDFVIFLINFVLALFVKDWHLTFGQSGAILFASGVAAIPGGIFFGWLGDKIGRRKVFMTTILTFCSRPGVMALAPERSWVSSRSCALSLVWGSAAWPPPICHCCRSLRPRPSVAGSAGYRSAYYRWVRCWAAALSASLGTVIGWRGLFAVGLLPALMAFVIRLWVPESPRWLLNMRRLEEVRRSLAWALQLDPQEI